MMMNLSKRSAPYQQAYRAAWKDATAWLADRATRMADPHAVQVLNAAAFAMGQEKHSQIEQQEEVR